MHDSIDVLNTNFMAKVIAKLRHKECRLPYFSNSELQVKFKIALS